LAFLAGAVASQPALGAFGAGLLAASDEHPVCCQGFERLVGRARLKAAVERDLAGEIPSRSSSATVSGSSVFSLGLPTRVEAGRISPRAPRLVFSVTSASWVR